MAQKAKIIQMLLVFFSTVLVSYKHNFLYIHLLICNYMRMGEGMGDGRMRDWGGVPHCLR